MELKTLKDIAEEAWEGQGTYVINDIKELKAEAVKWVKRARNEYKRGNTADAIDFMEFFNLTEDDLK